MSLFFNFLKAAKYTPLRAPNGRFTSGAHAVGATGKSLEFPSGSKSTPNGLHGPALKPWKPPASPAHDPNAGWRKTPDNPNHDPHPLVVKDGKKAASGVIIHEPDGRVWLTKPTNSYGGYKYTLPKGSAEHDLTLQQNAVKEAYEETGLHVQITGHAGDYERDTSVGRYYHAKRIGGHPGKAGWESEAVTLAHPDDMHSLLNRSVDQKIAHDHAGAPPPPKKSRTNKDSSTWWNNFQKEMSSVQPMTFREALASTSSLEIAKKFNPQQPRGKGGKWTKGGGAFTAAHSLGNYKQDHPQVKSAHKFIGHVEGIVNHGAMSHSEKLTALAGLKVPKGANPYQKAKVEAFEQAHAHLQHSSQDDESGETESHESGPPAFEAAPKLGLTKVGGKLGSNEGGIYENGAGEKFYVKTPADPEMAKSEVLASKLYEAMGVKTLKPELTEVDGKVAVATPWNGSLKTVQAHGGPAGLNAQQKQSVQANFAAHVLLANWDAAGTGHDNQAFEKGSNQAVTVDGGGSLEYRAQGGKKGKAWNGDAAEWDSMRDAKVSPHAAELFGDMNSSQLQESAKKVSELTDDKIKNLVSSYGPGSSFDKAVLAKTLINRRNSIISHANYLADMKNSNNIKTNISQADINDKFDAVGGSKKEVAAVNAINSSYNFKNAKLVYADHAKHYGKSSAEADAYLDAIKGKMKSKISDAHHAYLEANAKYSNPSEKNKPSLDLLKKLGAEYEADNKKFNSLTPDEKMSALAKRMPKEHVEQLNALTPEKLKEIKSVKLPGQDGDNATSYVKAMQEKINQANSSAKASPAAKTEIIQPKNKALQSLTPPALPEKLDESKLTSKANASKSLLAKNDQIHQIGQDYASGKINSDEAHQQIGAIQDTLGKKQHYHLKLNAHAEDVKAAIAAHAAGGKAASPVKAAAKTKAASPEAPKGVDTVRPRVKPFDPSKLQEPPSFKNWGGTGKSGPSALEHINQNNEDSVQKLYEAAKTGDVDAVKATKLNVLDKATGALKEQTTYDKHPSQHVKSFGHQMMAEIDKQKNPPKVFKPKAGSALKQIHEAFPTKSPKDLAPHQKVYTKYIHLGHVDENTTNEDLGISPHQKLGKNEGLGPHTYADEGNKAWHAMSTAQREALKSYTGSGYEKQNKGMWAGNPDGQAKAAANAINTFGHTIKPGTVLSRYVDLPASDIEQIMKGKHSIIQEPAIMSTSVTPHVWSGNTHLKLTVGNGVKGIYAGENSTHAHENEMILPPNARLLITHVENTGGKVDADGFGQKGATRVIHATILPNGG